MKRFHITLENASTGSYTSFKLNHIKEVECSIEEYRHERSYMVCVFDYELNDFIFLKDPFKEVEIDMINSYSRDFRTSTRQVKK